MERLELDAFLVVSQSPLRRQWAPEWLATSARVNRDRGSARASSPHQNGVKGAALQLVPTLLRIKFWVKFEKLIRRGLGNAFFFIGSCQELNNHRIFIKSSILETQQGAEYMGMQAQKAQYIHPSKTLFGRTF